MLKNLIAWTGRKAAKSQYGAVTMSIDNIHIKEYEDNSSSGEPYTLVGARAFASSYQDNAAEGTYLPENAIDGITNIENGGS